MELALFLIGDLSRTEFQQAESSIARQAAVSRFADLDSATAALAEGQLVPDLIVVAQAFPGQFSPHAIDRLRRLAPLARLVTLLGGWCEGETRTGKPIPGSIRVGWHQWSAESQRELTRLAAGEPTSWGLPVTAGDDERLLAIAQRPVDPRSGCVVIWSRSAAMHDWLAGALRGRGQSTVWLQACGASAWPTGDEVVGAVFDASDGQGAELTELECVSATLGTRPVVVLMDFPRARDCDRILAAGGSAVLAKPVLLEDLFWLLDSRSRVERAEARTPTGLAASLVPCGIVGELG